MYVIFLEVKVIMIVIREVIMRIFFGLREGFLRVFFFFFWCYLVV